MSLSKNQSAVAPPSVPLKDALLTETVDVIVVGSGGSGLTAAIMAAESGASVLVLEKGDHVGGTTLKSGAGVWVPNNRHMEQAGIEDSVEASLEYVARVSRPDLFAANQPRFGLPEWEYELLEVFCRTAGEAFASLEDIGALSMMPLFGLPNYYAELEENRGVPQGRTMVPQDTTKGTKSDGDPSMTKGPEMIRQLRNALETRGGEIRLDCRVTSAIVSENRVVGVITRTPDGDKAIGARKGVVFASGGFTHNESMVRDYLPAPIYGGCAATTNEGDFVPIAQILGGVMRSMNQAWNCPVVLDYAARKDPSLLGTLVVVGHSILAVNRYGHRVANEKTVYADACAPMSIWDPVRAEYPNLPLFVVWDQATQDQFGGKTDQDGRLIPGPQDSQDHVVRAHTLEELGEGLNKHLTQFSAQIGDISLADDFTPTLLATVDRYNALAIEGVDHDFHRGESAFEQVVNVAMLEQAASAPTGGMARDGAAGWSDVHEPSPDSKAGQWPNDVMAPLADNGPYYAAIIVPGTLDTKGGPQTNASGQVLNYAGQPIAGLYAVGNCAASPTGRGYYGAGGTLGPMITYAWLAGQHIAKQRDAF